MENKVVVITGGSGGIGEALAKVFAGKKSRVVIGARDEVKLSDTVQKITAAGGICHAVRCDVSSNEDCKHLIDEAVKKFGTIDIMICNAGISMRALFDHTDLSVIHRLMNINFWGTVYCTKHSLPYLKKNKGSLIGISSIAGKVGLPARSGYSASKFAMEGFLETIRTENLKNDLHVLVACPGFTSSNIRNTALSADGTSQGESPRDESNMMSADEVALRIYHAIVARKRDLVLTTNGKLSVFLKKIFPSMMDRMVYNHMEKETGSPLK